jgi:hypothetical protein
MNPKQFEPSETEASSVGAVVCERTKLEGDPGKQVAVGTGTLESIPADLVRLYVLSSERSQRTRVRSSAGLPFSSHPLYCIGLSFHRLQRYGFARN